MRKKLADLFYYTVDAGIVDKEFVVGHKELSAAAVVSILPGCKLSI